MFFCNRCRKPVESLLTRVYSGGRIGCVDCFDRLRDAVPSLRQPIVTPCAYCGTHYACGWRRSKIEKKVVCMNCHKRLRLLDQQTHAVAVPSQQRPRSADEIRAYLRASRTQLEEVDVVVFGQSDPLQPWYNANSKFVRGRLDSPNMLEAFRHTGPMRPHRPNARTNRATQRKVMTSKGWGQTSSPIAQPTRIGPSEETP